VNFLAELKRRNVFRLAGLYLVGAWLVVQVAETVLPAFEVPDAILRGIILLLAIGFVPALIVSWLFELTPEGLVRDEDLIDARSPSDEPGNQSQRAALAPEASTQGGRNRRVDQRLNRMIIGGLLLALALLLVDRFYQSADDPARANTQSSGDLIAVLPFVNRSPNEEDAFFTEGIYDDLLTQLAKVSRFKVISRTSMSSYEGSGMLIPAIAAQLGAGVVLEGAVQRAGDRVRITVQLIDGATDVHLWAETYDRLLTTQNLFDIQGDVAWAIARAMQLVISPEEASALVTGSTDSLSAYEAFLQGKLLSAFDVATAERFESAIANFERATAIDVNFADAYARKARVELAHFWFGYGDAGDREAAVESLAQARALAPDSIETLMAEAYMHYWGERDYSAAEEVLGRVLDKSPGYADAWYTRGLVARRDGRFEQAIEFMRYALTIDPANTDIIRELMATLEGLGRYAESEALMASSSAWVAGTASNTAELLWVRGDYDAAWAAVDGPNEFDPALPFRIARDSRDPERIRRSLSAELWPEELRSVPAYPEHYAMAAAEGLLVVDRMDEGQAALAEIAARLSARETPYPAGWSASSALYYYPSDLPGMQGDLEGVRAAERDFIANAARDAWSESNARISLAIAFARADDPERALDYLESLANDFGPANLVLDFWGLEKLRNQPRFQELMSARDAWAVEQDRLRSIR